MGAIGADAVLQLPRIHGARECDVGDPSSSSHNSQAPLSRLGGDSVLRHSFSRSWTAARDPCRWEPEGHGTGRDGIPRAQLVAWWRVWHIAVSAWRCRRDLHPHVHLHGHAGGTPVATARTLWRRSSHDTVGIDTPYTCLVLRDPFSDWYGLRIADDGHRGFAESRTCVYVAYVRRPGDCGV